MNNKTNLRANSAGLSLIEGLIAFAVIGAVAFFGFSYFKSIQGDSNLTASIGDFGDNTELDEIAKAIVSDLGIVQARSKTGVKDVEWGVCFRNNKDKNKDLYEVVSSITSSNTPCNPGSDGEVESTINLPKDIFMSDPLIEQTRYVVFKRITGATTSPTDINITISSESDDSRTITITPEGIITYSGSSVVIAESPEEPAAPATSTTSSSSNNSSIPSSPRSLAAAPGVSKVAIAWSAPSFRGSSAIIEYRIYRTTTSGVRGSFIDSVTPSTFSFIDNDVQDGTTYFYRVTARNSAGESGVSNQVPATPFAATPTPSVTPTQTTQTAQKTTPSAPRNLRATPGNTQVALSWDVPSSNGNSTIIEYRLYRSLISGGSPTFVGATPGTAFTDTGLDNGTRYYYRVEALNSLGAGTRSSEVRAIPRISSTSSDTSSQTAAAPSVPRNLAAEPGNHKVSLSWGAPSSSGGSDITEYRLYRSLVSNGPRTFVSSTPGTAYTDTGLSNGTRYYYSIEARNSTGVGPRSSEVMATPMAGETASDNNDNDTSEISPASAPTNVDATAESSGIVLTWSAPSSNGGASITNYNVAKSTTSNGTAKLFTVSDLSFTDTNVESGKTYYYRVWANNGYYNGTRSVEVSAVAE